MTGSPLRNHRDIPYLRPCFSCATFVGSYEVSHEVDLYQGASGPGVFVGFHLERAAVGLGGGATFDFGGAH